jgi:DNA-binding CsgD family transcriptional regulator
MAAEHALATYAPEEAATLINRALQVKGVNDQEKLEADSETAALLRMRGRALADMGSPEGAESLVRAFITYIELGDLERAVEVALLPVGTMMIQVGSFKSWIWLYRGAAELLERALSIVIPGSIEQGRLLSQSLATSDLEKAIDIARREGDEAPEMWAVERLATLRIFKGDFIKSAREEARAMDIAERLGDCWAMHHCLYWGRYRCMLTGDGEGARNRVQALLELAEKTRSKRMLFRAHRVAAVQASLTGEWDLCRQHAKRSLSLQPTRADTWDYQATLTALVLTELETGRFDRAKQHLDTLRNVPHGDQGLSPFAVPKIVRITGDTTRLEAAEATARKVELGPAPFEAWTMMRQIALALIAVLHSDPVEAAEYLEYFIPLKGIFGPNPHYGKSTDALLGLLCVTTGKLEEAAVHFEDALAFCRHACYRPELAWTYYDYAEALISRHRAQDLARARKILEQGQTLTRELGMLPLLEKVDASFRRLKETKTSYPAGLTQRETEVLRLATQGMTNSEIGERLFITSQTVARHMHNLLQKTGMANRAEATAWAIRNGLAE